MSAKVLGGRNVAAALAIAVASGFLYGEPSNSAARPAPPPRIGNETPERFAERTKWFVEDRFGMFIHFGLYSLPAWHEWVKSRVLHLPGDFILPYGSFTRGGEFPGAKAHLDFPEEGGRRFARLSFDLSEGRYVGYKVDERMPSGTTRMAFKIRLSSPPGETRLQFRVEDSAHQTHAQSMMFAPTGEWTVVEFDFSKASAHWGGPNDGVLRLPSVACTLCVEPGRSVGKGHLDVADVVAVTTAGTDEIPSATLGCAPARLGAIYYPDETPTFRIVVSERDKTKSAPRRQIDCRVFDWLGREVCRRRATDGLLELTPAELGGRFGVFRLVAEMDGEARAESWFARLSSKEVAPCRWIGTQCHFHRWGNPRQVSDMIAAAGIGIVRDEPLWDCCERVRGVFAAPDGFDAYVDELLARGVKMNMTLTYENGIYDNPLDPEAFALFAGWAARHYRGRVDRFEIWNEPQNFCFKKRYGKEREDDSAWLGKFIELTHLADEAIRMENPDAVVGVTGEDMPELLEKMIAGGIAKSHNAIAFHPYCHSQPRPEREYFLKDFGSAFRQLARRHGGAERWCITESGWTTYEGVGEYWQVAGSYPRASLQGQAAYIVRMYLSALEAGCEYACQYDFRDDGPRREYTEHNFGLVHADYTPKPAYGAVAFLTRCVGHLRYVDDLSQRKDECRVAEFASASGEVGGKVLVAWSIEGESEWELPEACGRLVECRDLMGNVIEPPVVRGRRLKLTEFPVYMKCHDKSPCTVITEK